MTIRIRAATVDDVADIHRFLSDLAAYEQLSDQMAATPADLAAALFAEAPRVFCTLAEADGVPAGVAVWYYSFSTFAGRHGLFLADLYVDPAVRGRGVGRALLASLARRCLDEDLSRFEWEVLDWNQPAIDFYEAHDAVLMRGWVPVRLHGDALRRLADRAS